MLIFRHQVIHIGLGFGELHFVHTFACVPMQESLAPEHGRELFGYAFEYFLDGGRIADERGGHFQTPRRYVTHSDFHVAGYPLHEISKRTFPYYVHCRRNTNTYPEFLF